MNFQENSLDPHMEEFQITYYR